MNNKEQKDFQMKEEIEMTKSALLERQDQYVIEMDKYINEFKNLPREEARRQARESLIRSGVLNSKGNPKRNICSKD